jgi:hypothetical protein
MQNECRLKRNQPAATPAALHDIQINSSEPCSIGSTKQAERRTWIRSCREVATVEGRSYFIAIQVQEETLSCKRIHLRQVSSLPLLSAAQPRPLTDINIRRKHCFSGSSARPLIVILDPWAQPGLTAWLILVRLLSLWLTMLSHSCSRSQRAYKTDERVSADARTRTWNGETRTRKPGGWSILNGSPNTLDACRPQTASSLPQTMPIATIHDRKPAIHMELGSAP